MTLPQWIILKIGREFSPKTSLRYNKCLYTHIHIKPPQYFKAFKEYYDKHLKGRQVSALYDPISLFTLGGVKLTDGSMQITLWLPQSVQTLHDPNTSL